jgi:hypothetical protein
LGLFDVWLKFNNHFSKITVMKLIKSTLFSLVLIGSMTACTTSTNNNDGNKQGKEYTSAYVCPMHCEGSGSDSAGLCPVCGMDYIKNDKK